MVVVDLKGAEKKGLEEALFEALKDSITPESFTKVRRRPTDPLLFNPIYFPHETAPWVNIHPSLRKEATTYTYETYTKKSDSSTEVATFTVKSPTFEKGVLVVHPHSFPPLSSKLPHPEGSKWEITFIDNYESGRVTTSASVSPSVVPYLSTLLKLMSETPPSTLPEGLEAISVTLTQNVPNAPTLDAVHLYAKREPLLISSEDGVFTLDFTPIATLLAIGEENPAYVFLPPDNALSFRITQYLVENPDVRKRVTPASSLEAITSFPIYRRES